MKIVVDANIIISALFNLNSRISELIIQPPAKFQYYTPAYALIEIEKHRKKILSYSKLTTEELDEAMSLLFFNIRLIDDIIIPEKIKIASELKVKQIDIYDAPYLALADYLKAILWTGDKQLQKGLIKIGFNNVVTTAELSSFI